MGIRSIIKTNWDDAVRIAAMYNHTDIYPGQRSIVMQKFVGRFCVGELVMMFDKESGKCNMVTTRYTFPALGIPATFHAWDQHKRIVAAGHTCNYSVDRGLITCVYSRAGWLESFLEQSSGAAPPELPEHSTPTTSEPATE